MHNYTPKGVTNIVLVLQIKRKFILTNELTHVGPEGACDSSSCIICMWSDREGSSEILHFLTFSRILLVQRVMSITSSCTEFQKVGIAPVLRISKSVVIIVYLVLTPIFGVLATPQLMVGVGIAPQEEVQAFYLTVVHQ